MKRLPRSFYARPTPVVARALLGRRLVRVLPGPWHSPALHQTQCGEVGRRLAGRIVAVEAYTGPDDAASHAHRGRTPRNAPMFGPPGHAYVYFIYGMHWMFNVVAYFEKPPGAVLVRALSPEEGLAAMRELRGGRPDQALTNGPARLAQALSIDGSLSGVDLCTHPHLFIEPGAPVPDEAVACGPRVGVVGDERARTRPWRFWVKVNE
jgi:DNA-3-methyladenine glycosylase